MKIRSQEQLKQENPEMAEPFEHLKRLNADQEQVLSTINGIGFESYSQVQDFLERITHIIRNQDQEIRTKDPNVGFGYSIITELDPKADEKHAAIRVKRATRCNYRYMTQSMSETLMKLGLNMHQESAEE